MKNLKLIILFRFIFIHLTLANEEVDVLRLPHWPATTSTVTPSISTTLEPVGCPKTETDPDGDCIVGVGGTDYPIYTSIPETSFRCYNQELPGYYADVEASCQLFHICEEDGRQHEFLCPIGTIFNQTNFVCDWWSNVLCGLATTLYHLNKNIGVIPLKIAEIMDDNEPGISFQVSEKTPEFPIVK